MLRMHRCDSSAEHIVQAQVLLAAPASSAAAPLSSDENKRRVAQRAPHDASPKAHHRRASSVHARCAVWSQVTVGVIAVITAAATTPRPAAWLPGPAREHVGDQVGAADSTTRRKHRGKAAQRKSRAPRRCDSRRGVAAPQLASLWSARRSARDATMNIGP